MNQDDVRVQSIDSRRKHGIEPYPMKQFIPQPENPVYDDPKEKLQDMRTRDLRYAMPNHASRGFGGMAVESVDGKVLHVLGVQVNLTRMVTNQSFEQFSECPLGAVASIDKLGQGGDPQII